MPRRGTSVAYLAGKITFLAGDIVGGHRKVVGDALLEIADGLPGRVTRIDDKRIRMTVEPIVDLVTRYARYPHSGPTPA